MVFLTKKERTASIARWNKVLRELNMTRTDLATAMGVSRQTVNRWNNIETNGAPISKVIEFCHTYDVSLLYLSAGIGPRSGKELKTIIALGELSASRAGAIARFEQNLDLTQRASKIIDEMQQKIARLELEREKTQE